MPAMIYFHFIHKTGETADIRNKYEAFVVHRWRITLQKLYEFNQKPDYQEKQKTFVNESLKPLLRMVSAKSIYEV